MAATKITNSGTEPFVLPSPLRGIIAPGQTVFLNLTFAQVATALGGSNTYLPPNGAILNIQLSYDPAYAGAYNSYYEGAAGGANSVAIPAGRIPYGNGGGGGGDDGTFLTSEAALNYNASTNTLSADVLQTTIVRGLTNDLSLRPAVAGGSVTVTAADGTTARIESNATGLGFFGTAPVARPTSVTVDAAGIHAALVSLGLITA
jgi:hypothetical protein